MVISGTKDQGWRAIPTQYRKASDILTSTCFFIQQPPKKGKGIDRRICADNRERQLHTTRQK